ncbi:MAG: hypothetical protein AAF664_00965 [Planctomycetota bacterium]
MRTLFILAILIVAAFMANWFTIERDGDNTSVHFNNEEIREDTSRVIDRGREIWEKHREERQAQQLRQEGAFGNDGLNAQPGTQPPTDQLYYDADGFARQPEYLPPAGPPAGPPQNYDPRNFDSSPYYPPEGQPAGYRLP